MPRHPTCRDPSPQTSYSGRPGTASTTGTPFLLGHSVVDPYIFLSKLDPDPLIRIGHGIMILNWTFFVAIGKKYVFI
jgi:hypothetical protein